MEDKKQYYEWIVRNLETPDVWDILKNDPNIKKRFWKQKTSSGLGDDLIHIVIPNYQAPVADYQTEIRVNISNMILNARLNGSEISECGQQLDYILTDKGLHDLLARFAEKLGDSAVLEVIDEFLDEAEQKGNISGRLRIVVERHRNPKQDHVEGNYEVKLLLGDTDEPVVFDDKKWDKWGKLLYLFFLLHPGERIPRSEIPSFQNQLEDLYWEAFGKKTGRTKSDFLPVIQEYIDDLLEQLPNSGNDKFSHAKSMANKAVSTALEGKDDEKWYIIDTEKEGKKAVYTLRTPKENIILPDELKKLYFPKSI